MSRRRKGGLPPGKLSLTGAAKSLGIDRGELAALVNGGEIPHHRIENHNYIDESTVNEIASRAESAAAELDAESRRAELESYRRLGTPASLPTDKQVRQRSGNDDHLELGEYKPPKPRRVPPGSVTRDTVTESRPDSP